MTPKRQAVKPASTSTSRATTSKGTQRVYVDLPADLVRRFNILAATRALPKRTLLSQIVEAALKEASL